MKTVSAELRNHLNSMISGESSSLAQFDLYTITTTLGTVCAYTTADFPIFPASSDVFDVPRIEGDGTLWSEDLVWYPMVFGQSDSRSTARWKMGLDADTWNFTIAPRLIADGYTTDDEIDGVPFLLAAQRGALDGADCVVSRCYFSSMPTWDPLSESSVARGPVSPLGTITLFRGYMGEVTCTSTSVSMVVNDYRRLLQLSLPRNFYTGSCRHTLGDHRCGVSLTPYTFTTTIATGSTRSKIVTAVEYDPIARSWSFTQGTITVLSGRNAGISRLIVAQDSTNTFRMLTPFPYDILLGDSVQLVAGCGRTLSSCSVFSNRDNYGGDPFIPLPETTL